MSPQVNNKFGSPAITEFPPGPIFRIAKKLTISEFPYELPARNFSKIAPEDNFLSSGNRFDLIDIGTLYCATERLGAFAEVLAFHRPSSRMKMKINENEDFGFMMPGSIPADWRDSRNIFCIECEDPALFIDLEKLQTLTFLDKILKNQLIDLGIDSELDASLVKGQDKRITRLISKWACEQVDEDENPIYSGIRYLSRHGDFECWAIYEGTSVFVQNIESIEKSDLALNEIAKYFELVIH